MDLNTFLAKYIRQTLNYPTHYVITKDDYNNILNLLIAQGDYNSEAVAQIITELLQAEADLDAKVTSANIKGISYADGKLQVTIDGVAWVLPENTGDLVLVPHTHGNITADGKLPIANAYVKTDASGNIVSVENIGSTEATPAVLVQRDANGRAQIVAPAADADIANKGYVDPKVASAAQSVYDTASGKYVKLAAGIDCFTGTQVINIPASLVAADANGGTLDSDQTKPSTVRIGDKIVFRFGVATQTGTYWAVVIIYDTITKTFTTPIKFSTDVNYYAWGFDNIKYAFSTDGNILCGQYYSTGRLIFDAKYNTALSAIPANGFGVHYGTDNYYGYLYVNTYTDRKLYYAPRNTTTLNYVTLPNGPSSSYNDVKIIGVYGNTVYYLDQIAQNYYKLSKVVLSASPVITDGMANYDMKPTLYPVIISGRYSISTMINGSSYRDLYILDMATGLSNYSSLTFNPATSDLYDNVYGTYYIGSVNGKAYFCYNGATRILDVATRTIESMISHGYSFSDYGVFTSEVQFTNPNKIITNGKMYYDVQNTFIRPIHSVPAYNANLYYYYLAGYLVSISTGTASTLEYTAINNSQFNNTTKTLSVTFLGGSYRPLLIALPEIPS